MPNPLFSMLNKNGANPIGDFMTKFNQFKSTINGNPEQIVRNLLATNQMSQEQFNQLSQMANQIMPYLK